MGSKRGWLAGDWPSTGGVLNITAAACTAGFYWGRSGNITRTQNVSEYMLVLALCLVWISQCWLQAPAYRSYDSERLLCFGRAIFMAALWNRAGHNIFALWFLSSSFFLRLECRSEMCCTRLAENANPKNRQKFVIWVSSHNFVEPL